MFLVSIPLDLIRLNTVCLSEDFPYRAYVSGLFGSLDVRLNRRTNVWHWFCFCGSGLDFGLGLGLGTLDWMWKVRF